MPYETSELKNNLPSFREYYNDIIIYEARAGMHPKARFVARNQYIIDQSDLVVVYVERDQGGAASAMKYARKIGKSIINLYHSIED